MSLENKIDLLTGAITSLIVQLQQGSTPAPAAPVAAPVAAPEAPVYAPPVAAAVIPAAPPLPTAPFPAPAAPAALPFNDNVSAAAWATAAWQAVAAVNQDVAMQKFGALMQAMGCADFNTLTPDKFPMLHQGVQAIKAELGVAG